VRNLGQVQLQDLEQVNVFYGSNGSGKTSVLEAIHLLGMARSFRGSSAKSLISHGEGDCVVFGLVSSPGHPAPVPLGIQRTIGGDVQIKVSGAPLRSVAQLVEHLPMQVINADTFDLLTGAPGARRRYLDWGVFHVEHRFLEQWQRFQRCIKQRNKLLRHGKIRDAELDVWTRDLATTGAALGEYRKAYFELLLPRFKEIISRLAPSLSNLELRYQQGWDRGLDYRDALDGTAATDIEQGYTHVGPQRADIKVMIDGRLAAETLSRGQQKLVVCSLKLAQGQLMTEQGKARCVYLVDDLPSELDTQHGRKVCELLAAMRSQVFITCIERRDIDDLWPEMGRDQMAMFHVEQGLVRRGAVEPGSAPIAGSRPQ
jgi:DNA replication and repair protein RecF